MNGEEVEVKESSVLSGPNYLELTGLEWNRRYDVWVKAATDVGYGSSSIITSIILGRIGKADRTFLASHLDARLPSPNRFHQRASQ